MVWIWHILDLYQLCFLRCFYMRMFYVILCAVMYICWSFFYLLYALCKANSPRGNKGFIYKDLIGIYIIGFYRTSTFFSWRTLSWKRLGKTEIVRWMIWGSLQALVKETWRTADGRPESLPTSAASTRSHFTHCEWLLLEATQGTGHDIAIFSILY